MCIKGLRKHYTRSVKFPSKKLVAQRPMDKAVCVKSTSQTECVCEREREKQGRVTPLMKQCVTVIRRCALDTTACAFTHT